MILIIIWFLRRRQSEEGKGQTHNIPTEYHMITYLRRSDPLRVGSPLNGDLSKSPKLSLSKINFYTVMTQVFLNKK